MDFDFSGVGFEPIKAEGTLNLKVIGVIGRSFFGIAEAEENPAIKQAHHKILIVGGGSGGIAVAAQLKKKLSSPDIAIVEPSDKHYYQPLWTLVGGGIFDKKDSERSESSVIPKGTSWIKDAVTEFHPTENFILTKDGKKISYDYMVVATGVELNWDKIKGLKDAMGKNGVCTNYSYQFVDATWKFFQSFRGGVGIFTSPDTPVKCGGAPMKIMWLFEDYCRRQGIRDKSTIIYALPAPSMFGVKKYSDALDKMRQEKGVEAKFKHTLVEVKGDQKQAIFKDGDGKEVALKYDFLHVTPPMGTHAFLRNSPLAAANGYVDVDKFTLQHNKFKNVFSLGDCANLPTSKTVAALTSQTPTVVSNLVSVINKKEPTAKYNGYTSCPIVTSYKDLMLAEFLYDSVPKETFPVDQSKPRWSFMFMKKYVFPRAYWDLFLTGNWYGPNLFWPPKENK
jgi:sulfide:quinone oxidoreductase